jgi:hypothetical protein
MVVMDERTCLFVVSLTTLSLHSAIYVVRYSGMVSQQCIGKNVEGSAGGLIELLFCHG